MKFRFKGMSNLVSVNLLVKDLSFIDHDLFGGILSINTTKYVNIKWYFFILKHWDICIESALISCCILWASLPLWNIFVSSAKSNVMIWINEWYRDQEQWWDQYRCLWNTTACFYFDEFAPSYDGFFSFKLHTRTEWHICKIGHHWLIRTYKTYCAYPALFHDLALNNG